jgi:lipopolysaccharide/colanic/teichoic acid biosynthesis glycosyltransferase
MPPLRTEDADLKTVTPLHGPAHPRNNPRPALTRRPSAPLPSLAGLAVPAVRVGDRVKSATDLFAAALFLAVCLPAIGLAMLLMKATSRGPVLYTQSRVGRGGRVSTIYKVRTMYHECESLTGPRWSIPGDPRITPVGKVLRDLHVDELPQLWNVVRGDMSLIGPRPERPEICDEIRREIPGYDRRHAVKPGITGFAQVHLPPDTSMGSVRNKLIFDRFYVRHRGLRLEVYILGCTVLKLLGLRNLYQRSPRKPASEDE